MVIWRQDVVLVEKEKPAVTWAAITSEIANVAGELQLIRTASTRPCGQLLPDPLAFITNFNAGGRMPYVELRTAAQLLYVDCLASLHRGDTPRARESLHALVRLSCFGQEDLTLVSAMIRVAIANLALQANWQALQAETWTETELGLLQAAWEEVDLLSALEFGHSGERAASLVVFDLCRQRGVLEVMHLVSPTATPSLADRFKAQALALFWQPQEDELFALRQHAEMIEAIRSVRQGTPWPIVRTVVEARQTARLNQMDRGGWFGRTQYLVSHLALPNTTRSLPTTMRTETQRQLTITAIALRRSVLVDGAAPATLAELVPQFLSTSKVDPLSGRALGYQRLDRGRWRLYSVGDNGGDSNPPEGVKDQNQWTGRDVVWPVPAN